MFKNIFKILLASCALFGTAAAFTAGRIPDTLYFSKGRNIAIKSLPAVTLDISEKTSAAVGRDSAKNYTANFLGIIPLKDVTVVESGEKYVNVSGKPFGVKMFCDGVMVVGFSDILTDSGYKNPAKAAGLKTADIITAIDDTPVQTNEDVERIITKNGHRPLKISYIRQDKERQSYLVCAVDKNTSGYRSGMWVRDSGAGIGTMTFYDTERGYFAGLGHGIKDADTRQELRLLSGEIVPVKITGIVKSKNGSAGRLKGQFISALPRGKLLYNGATGVCGTAYGFDSDNMMPVASAGEIKEGDAYILTTISGTQPRRYKIKIEKISLNSRDQNKNLVIRITDQRLLSLTGGIVRGMSGSPIVQSGKLVGAVTHVFVNQVDRGYGIFAENMLKTLDAIDQSRSSAA